MAHPLISVIVPARNAARYLAECLQSILAQQGRHHFEILVVDDGSTDGTRELAEEFFRDHATPGIAKRCVRQSPSGAASARNRGVEESRGDWLAFLDADDLWVAEKTERQWAAALSRPDCDAILGAVQNFVSPELSDTRNSKPAVRPEPRPAPMVSTLLIRRDSYFRVGEMNPALPVGEFIDWYGRALHVGLQFHMLPETVLLRRLHDENQGIRKRQEYAQAYRHILRDHLERRKARASRTP